MHTSAVEHSRNARHSVPSGITARLFGQTPGVKALRTRINDGLDLVEQRLREAAQIDDTLAAVTTGYLLDAGGKRMRPVLALVASELGDDPVNETVIKCATALELTHLASLYHDDVMDEADLRRGVPAAQLNWGNSIAILAGDLLFSRASRLFSELGEPYLTRQSEMFERLVLGQMHETVGPREGDDPVAHYVDVLRDKTGALIAAAAEFGARASGAPEVQIEAMRNFGERIGVAFQLADDVIDLSPQSEKTGKLAGTDLRAGVETLPVLLLARRAEHDAAAADLLHRIRTRVAGTAPAAIVSRTDAQGRLHEAEVLSAEREAEVSAIIAELREHEVVEITRREAAQWMDAALESLDRIPSGLVKRALTKFAEEVVARDR